jgi:PhnB protein
MTTGFRQKERAMNDVSKKTGAAVHEMYPYLCVKDAGAAIEFYKRVFGAEELFRLTEPSGRIGHAEIKLGPATLMLSDEFPEYGFKGPAADARATVTIHLHVANADKMTQQAADAGATVLMKPTDQFYGERSSRVRDPFGHEWLLGHSIEEMSPAEMQRRYTEMMKG